MRGTVAKGLRKAVYGDLSLREERCYARAGRGGLVNVGERAVYQRAKKIYREKRRMACSTVK